jgi:hypothetical protein
MKSHQITVLAPNGQTEPAIIEVADGEPLRLIFRHETLDAIEAIDDDAFEALVQIRLRLEPAGYKLLCNAARRDVYPSAMSRQMSRGFSAYKLTLGRYAKMEDLVRVLDPAPPETIGTVAEQRAFFESYFNAKKRKE